MPAESSKSSRTQIEKHMSNRDRRKFLKQSSGILGVSLAGMLGANGIVGAGPTLATGAGLSIRRRGEGNVCVSFFGEGAMAEGQVHEAMNLAGVRDLPVVFVCENNGYGEMTPAERLNNSRIVGYTLAALLILLLMGWPVFQLWR